MSRSRPTKAELAIQAQVDAEMERMKAEHATRKAAVLAQPDGAAEWERLCETARAASHVEYRAVLQRYQAVTAEKIAAHARAVASRPKHLRSKPRPN